MIHPDVAERLNKARSINKSKLELEGIYRAAKAGEKPFFAQLFLKTEGKSVAEREYKVYASNEWQQFAQSLVSAETNFNWIRIELEIQMSGVIGEMSGAKYSQILEEGA